MDALNPKKKDPYGNPFAGAAIPAPTVATTLGQGARDLVGASVGNLERTVTSGIQGVEAVTNAATAPTRKALGQVQDFGRGLLGMPQRTDAGAPLAGVSLPRPFAASSSTSSGVGSTASPTGPAPGNVPDFSNVRSGMSSVQAQRLPRPTLSDPPALPNSEQQTFINSLGQRATAPAGVTVTRGANGNPVFTATGDSVGAGNAALAVPSITTVPDTQIQRPTYGGAAQAASIENPGEDQRRLEIALSSATGRTARNRGERALQAQLVQGLMQQANTREALEAQANNAHLEARTRTNIAHMGEVGQNYRTELADAGQTRRTGIGEQGATSRARMAQEGENYRLLNRPEYTPDGSGQLNYVQNGIARPVLDHGGQPMRSGAGGLSASEVKDAYEKARQAVIDTTPMGQQPDFSGLAQSQVGQAFASLFEGPAGPRPRLQRTGQPDEYRQSILESFSQGQPAGATPTPAQRAHVATSRGFKIQTDASGAPLVEIDGQWWPL